MIHGKIKSFAGNKYSDLFPQLYGQNRLRFRLSATGKHAPGSFTNLAPIPILYELLSQRTPNFGTWRLSKRVLTGKGEKTFFRLEDGMKYFKYGCIAAIAAFLVCFATIPLNAQTRIYSSILPQEPRSYLGIQMDDVTADNLAKYKLNSERGAIIRSVVKGSPAEAAKLQTDDVILEFAGIQVWSAAHLTRLVQETPPGRKVDLAISRDGKRMSLTAEVKERTGGEFEERSQTIPNLRDFGDLERFLGPTERRSFQYRIPNPQEDRNPNLGKPNLGKPKLGVTLQPLSDQLAEYFGVTGKKGVLVSSVAGNSPSSGKLNSGDVIISADGKQIEDPEDLIQLVQNKSEGDINLKVVRNKKEISVVINLPEEQKENKGFKL
jgi:membrane-associated protease RseP (regulator of RpoE activity)